MKAFADNFTKKSTTKFLRWNYSLMWQAAKKKTRNHLHKSVSLADKQEKVESLLKKLFHQSASRCQAWSRWITLSWFIRSSLSSVSICLALILTDSQVPCQSWPRGKFLWFEGEVWWLVCCSFGLCEHQSITSGNTSPVTWWSVYNGIW